MKLAMIIQPRLIAAKANRWTAHLISFVFENFMETFAYARFKFKIFSIIGIIGFPLYYYIWAFLYPQPYESVGFRVVGFLLSVGLAWTSFTNVWWRRSSAVYSFFALTYIFPFFFTYMLLMNDLSSVWQLSFIASIVYVTLLLDVTNAVISTMIGVACAIFAYYISTDFSSLPENLGTLALVFSFIFTGIAFLNYSNNLITHEKLSGATSLMAQIAHEIRTPLMGIRLDAVQSKHLLNKFVGESISPRACNKNNNLLTSAHLSSLNSSLDRIVDHANSAEQVMSISLSNVTGRQSVIHDDGPHSISDVIDKAMTEFHFSRRQKDLVHLDLAEDFQFHGSEVLMKHVVFNLLKNALRAIKQKGAGEINIRLQKSPYCNELIFTDSGIGIPPEFIRYVFLPFRSFDEFDGGAGIGLWFCRKTISQMGGTLTANSTFGKETKFIVSFPV